MLQRLLDSLARSADAGLAGPHWPADIRTFLQDVDDQLEAGMPTLELGFENRPVLKLNLLPTPLFTTAHLDSLPWLDATQRGLMNKIRQFRPRFQYGLKLLPEGRELEIYVHETPEADFRRRIFASADLAGLPDPHWLRAWALTNQRVLSSYWANPEDPGPADLPASVLEAMQMTPCRAEIWRHYTWDGKRWGPAKSGTQFVPASATLDAALRRALPDLRFLDMVGAPAARHSAHMASGAGRHCLYLTMNRESA